MAEQAPIPGKEIVAVPEGDPMRSLFNDLSMQMRLLVGRTPLDPTDLSTELFEKLTVSLANLFGHDASNRRLMEPRCVEFPTAVDYYVVKTQAMLNFVKKELGATEVPMPRERSTRDKTRNIDDKNKRRVSTETVLLENVRGRKKIEIRTLFFNNTTGEFEKTSKILSF